MPNPARAARSSPKPVSSPAVSLVNEPKRFSLSPHGLREGRFDSVALAGIR